MAELRVGLGTDSHRLRPGGGIRLGGVDIPCAFACEAVSDGDVLLHALVDAILGALGLGDIGECYPESAVRPGEDSRRFVTEILALPGAAGVRLVNVDCVIHLERPRLAEWKPRIRDGMAALLGVAPSRVNVKAKTAEGLGPVGEGREVAAQVVVLLEVPS